MPRRCNLKQDFLKVLYSTSTYFFLTVKSDQIRISLSYELGHTSRCATTDPLASIDTARGETNKLSCFKWTRTCSTMIYRKC